jgi:hypothetical protein
MLCQLVCTDRRYARMNCFNIKELQGILKRKFFADLVNTHDYKALLPNTMIALRYKLNNTVNLDLDTINYYNYGVSFNNPNTFLSFNNNIFGTGNSGRHVLSSFNYNILSNTGLNKSCSLIIIDFLKTLTFNFNLVFINLLLTISNVLTFNLFNLFSNINFVSYFHNLTNNFNFNFLSVSNPNIFLNSTIEEKSDNFNVTNKIDYLNNLENASFSEISNSQRFTRFSNPLINYDYKTGNYIGD